MSDDNTNVNAEIPQTEIDAAMEEADIMRRIERKLLHVDRVTEETLVTSKVGNGQLLSLVVMVAIVGAMVYMLSREIKGLQIESVAP